MHKLLALTPLALALVACGGGGDTSTEATMGSLSLGITDGPVDYADSVVIQFTGVTLKPAGGNSITIDFTTVKNIDLLDYQGAASEPLLVNETVPAGEYNWIELHVNAEQNGASDSYLVDASGQHELRIPSGAQSGLRLVSGFVVAAGGVSNFTIDFDLRKSITSPPGPGSDPTFILRPALRLVNNLEVGTIAGTIDNTYLAQACALDDVQESTSPGAVYLYSPVIPVTDPATDLSDTGGPIASALVTDTPEGGWSYEFGFVAAGSYSLAYTCYSGQDDPAVAGDELNFTGLVDVAVVAGQTTTQDFGP